MQLQLHDAASLPRCIVASLHCCSCLVAHLNCRCQKLSIQVGGKRKGAEAGAWAMRQGHVERHKAMPQWRHISTCHTTQFALTSFEEAANGKNQMFYSVSVSNSVSVRRVWVRYRFSWGLLFLLLFLFVVACVVVVVVVVGFSVLAFSVSVTVTVSVSGF